MLQNRFYQVPIQCRFAIHVSVGRGHVTYSVQLNHIGSLFFFLDLSCLWYNPIPACSKVGKQILDILIMCQSKDQYALICAYR